MTQQPTSADVGNDIWVRDYENGPWFLRRLVRIEQTQFGPFFVCERFSQGEEKPSEKNPATHIWAYAKRNTDPPSKTASGPQQIATVDPATMEHRCYTCRFWIDANACEEVAAFERPPRTFNQVCRECWANYPSERPKTMAHDLCAKWDRKPGLIYATGIEPAAAEPAE